jgi:hypothetical protein
MNRMDVSSASWPTLASHLHMSAVITGKAESGLTIAGIPARAISRATTMNRILLSVPHMGWVGDVSSAFWPRLAADLHVGTLVTSGAERGFTIAGIPPHAISRATA